MADVADLFFLHLEEDEEEQEIHFGSVALDPSPFCLHSSFFEEDDETRIQPIFSDQINRSFDLFDPRSALETLDTSDFRVFDGMENVAPDSLGLGLGLGFDVQEDGHEEEEVEDGVGDGLRIVGFETDSDSEAVFDPIDRDPDLRLCWDSLRLEDERRDFDDDFEWEEVDGRLDERDFLSMMVGERSNSDDGGDEEEESRNVDWEFLLSVNNVEMSRSIEIVEDGDFINPSEYEILFGQFADHDSAIRGSPPAAKSVVDNLPSIVLTKEDLEKNNAVCAVCKDEISLEEKVKQLPCLHHYHGECILPWLRMRNTCPVCRYELLTDDAEYEGWKAQRSSGDDGRRCSTQNFIQLPSTRIRDGLPWYRIFHYNVVILFSSMKAVIMFVLEQIRYHTSNNHGGDIDIFELPEDVDKSNPNIVYWHTQI